MKKKFLFIILLIPFLAIAKNKKTKNNNAPKLIVGIVIDQMRYDYLYQFQSNFSENGFKKMMNLGTNCQSCMLTHIPTYTAVGHSSIYTGSVPAYTGIVANDWYDKTQKKSLYCTEDLNVNAIGGDQKNGQMSPVNLWSSTITDELKLTNGNNSKVFGVSIKDRGAILPAGHLADGAYWFDNVSGNFITSTFYRNDLPLWLQKFNSRNLTDSLLAFDWVPLLDSNFYHQQVPDNNIYEGKLKNETTTAFPHNLKQFVGKDKGAIRNSPQGNTLSFMLAKELINNEELGEHNCDFLALSLSSTDYVGHFWGIDSKELEDVYIRLDRELGNFISFVENKVGKDNVVFFLTADHAAAHNPQYLLDHKLNAGFLWEKEEMKKIDSILLSNFGLKESILELANNYIYLNKGKIDPAKYENVKSTIIDFYKNDPRFDFVLDMENPASWLVPEPLKSMITNGFSHLRCGEILVIPQSQYYFAYSKTGTTHGAWNPYDTHIPLLWYGAGIPKQNIYKEVNMIDIAPTLASMLHIQMPNACVGKPIVEIINK